MSCRLNIDEIFPSMLLTSRSYGCSKNLRALLGELMTPIA